MKRSFGHGRPKRMANDEANGWPSRQPTVGPNVGRWLVVLTLRIDGFWRERLDIVLQGIKTMKHFGVRIRQT